MARGIRHYAMSQDSKSIIVTIPLPSNAEATVVKTKGSERTPSHDVVILSDAGWIEPTGLVWNGYPIRARLSLSCDLTDARKVKGTERSFEAVMRERGGSEEAAGIAERVEARVQAERAKTDAKADIGKATATATNGHAAAAR